MPAEELVILWRLRCNRSIKQHYYSTMYFRVWDMSYTWVNVAASIIILVLSSANWFNGTQPRFDWLLGFAGIVVVISSVMQYIFDFRTRWKEHEHIGAEYAALHRRLEQSESSGEVGASGLSSLRRRIDRLSSSAPLIPGWFWDRPRHLSRAIEEIEKRAPASVPSN